MTDKRFKIELEVITPLHVGTGKEKEWIRGADFAQKDGKVYVIDIRKAFDNKIDVSSLFVSKDHGIEDMDSWQLESISKYIFISPQKTNNEIKSCLRNQFLGTPVVAGSSIKGAIRSALFMHLGENELKQKRNKQQKDDQLVKGIFGDMNKGTDFMRFIRISDIEIPNDNKNNNPDTILVNTKLFNLQNNEPDKKWHGGWKNGQKDTSRDFSSNEFNTLYECIEPGKKGEGAIIFGRSGLGLLIRKEEKISYADNKKNLVNGEINELFKVINKATRKYLEEEEKFFSRYDEADNTSFIIESIKELKALIPDENTDTGSYCLLKMSAGVGFHAITGNWIYDDFINTGTDNGKPDGKKNKKSRKIAIYKGKNHKPYLTGFELMGFVKLRTISEKDIQYDKLLTEATTLLEAGNWQKAYEKVNKAKSVCPSRNEHDKIAKQCEKIKKDEAQKVEEQKKLNAYHEYTEFMNSKKWIEAKQKAELAEELGIKKTEHHTIIEKCEKAIKFSKPLAEIVHRGMSVGNIVGTTKTWINYQTFGEKEYLVLKEALIGIKEKDFKNKVGELRSLIGEDMANSLSKELFSPVIKPAKTENKIAPEEKVSLKAEGPAPEIPAIEKQNEQPLEVVVEQPQQEIEKEEGLINKIFNWFKNLI